MKNDQARGHAAAFFTIQDFLLLRLMKERY